MPRPIHLPVSEPAPRVYLVLGVAGAGRREVVADLISSGFAAEDTVGVLTSVAETKPLPVEAPGGQWRWTEEGGVDAAWPDGVGTLFFLADGRSNPVDLIEAVKPWLTSQGAQLVRVISVVHCALCHQHSAVVAWYDACIHFSDIVLLHRREGVPNKWMSDYQTRFAKNYLPCLVEMVKKGRVPNPALVLDEQVRRLSHWFDAPEDDGGWQAYVDSAEDVIIEDEVEPEPLSDEGADEDEYLARNLGGTRRKKIPDIADYVPADDAPS